MSDDRVVEAVSRVLARIMAEKHGGVWVPMTQPAKQIEPEKKEAA